MAKNVAHMSEFRIGSVSNRSQFYNEHTGIWYKRNTETGEIMGGKKEGTPYKGVRKEKI